MASVVGKRVNGRTYYYLVESARVDGRPRVVSQHYLGSAEDIRAAVAGSLEGDVRHHGGRAGPERSRHLPFGDVAAAWRVLQDLDLARIVDEHAGVQRAKVTAGAVVALDVLARVAAPQAGAEPERAAGTPDLAAWWPTTTAARFVRPRLRPADLDRATHRRSLRRLDDVRRAGIESGVFAALAELFGPEAPVLVLDIPGFADPVADGRGDPDARGSGADGRGDGPMDPDSGHMGLGSSQVGLGLVVTLDGAVPLLWEAYQPGSVSFTGLVERLVARYRSLGGHGTITVVADAAQNSATLVRPYVLEPSSGEVHLVGALRSGDHPELAGLPDGSFRPVDPKRFPGVTAREGRVRAEGSGGCEWRGIVVHSANLRDAQARTLAANLAQASRRLGELSEVLASPGTGHVARERVAAEVARISHFRWGDRLLSTRLDTTRSGALHLRWEVDERARTRLESELFGKQILVTDHGDWPIARVLTAYRARYRVEATLRHLARAPGPLPPADARPARAGSAGARSAGARSAGGRSAGAGRGVYDRRLDTLLTVLATTVAHLLRHRAQVAGIDVSARELLDLLAGIQETELRYPSTGGRPRTLRLLADRTPVQQQLFDLFDLNRYAP